MVVELNISRSIPRNNLLNKIIKIELLRYFRLNLNEEVRGHWTEYFKSNVGEGIDCDVVLTEFLKNLKFTTVEGKYLVALDGKVPLKGTDHTLDSVVKLFNYGNLNVKGSHLISNAFDYLKNNISKILLARYFGAI